MNRRRLILGGLALVVALAAAWYFASPSWTLYRMRAAARSGDSEAFAAYVDFPALRENMKGQMKARLQSEAKSERSGLGGLEIALGSVLVGPMVDSIVSPEGVRAAFAAKSEEKVLTDRNSMAPSLKLPAHPVIVRRGLAAFLVASQKHPDSGLVFTRHGLGWRLSGVDLPPG